LFNKYIQKLKVTILDRKVKDKKPFISFKIKNKSQKIIFQMKAIIYFYNKNGRIFFEYNCKDLHKHVLKPNYSIIYKPIIDGIDTNEWSKKITIKILNFDIK